MTETGVQRRLQREPGEDRPLAETERAHHPHVVLAEGVEHPGAHHARDHTAGVGGDDEHRQEQVRERAAEHGQLPVTSASISGA